MKETQVAALTESVIIFIYQDHGKACSEVLNRKCCIYLEYFHTSQSNSHEGLKNGYN